MDDDGETIAVLGAGRIAALNTTALAWQAEVRHRAELKTSALLVRRSAFETAPQNLLASVCFSPSGAT